MKVLHHSHTESVCGRANSAISVGCAIAATGAAIGLATAGTGIGAVVAGISALGVGLACAGTQSAGPGPAIDTSPSWSYSMGA